jgi:hypothetical protein
VTQDSFSLDGWTYYSQIRKCGKDGCKCAAGEPHGPYWYRRNRRSGDVEYVGKELPDGVGEAHFALSVQRADIMATQRKLLDQAQTLERLINGDVLTLAEKATVSDLGFGNCLVYPGGHGGTQDEP